MFDKAAGFKRRATSTVAMSLVVAATSLGSSGCTRRVTDFTVISTKNTMLVSKAEKRERRIKGEDCTFTLVGLPNMKEAVDDAIEKAGPGYDALVDGVIYYDDRFLYACYTVEGTPLRAKDGPPAGESEETEEPTAPERERTGRRGRTDRGNAFELREASPDEHEEAARQPVATPTPPVAPAPPPSSPPPPPSSSPPSVASDAPAVGDDAGAYGPEEAPADDMPADALPSDDGAADDASESPYVR